MSGFRSWLFAALWCGLLVCAPASAKEVHVFNSSFGSNGSGTGQFDQPGAVAVNNATHEVYVVDGGNDRVQEFNSDGTAVIGEFKGAGAPSGEFSGPTEIAVDNSGSPLDPSNEDVYVVDQGHGVIDKFSPSGAYLAQIAETPLVKNAAGETIGGPFEAGEAAHRTIEGVAVAPNGTVWVTIREGPIYSFSDALENKYFAEHETVYGGAQRGLAVDSDENIYFNTGGGDFVKVNSTGERTSPYPFGGDGKAFRVAIDPVGQEIFLDNRDAVEAFSLDGEPIESFGSQEQAFGGLTFSQGLAVDPGSGTIYVTDESIDTAIVFGALVQPSVTIGAVTEQEPTSFTLNGTVSPEGGPVSSCVFEYGTTSAYGQSVPCSPANLGTGSLPVSVSAHVEGLVPETVYHYRLVAENSAGKSPSVDREVQAGPVLSSQFVTDVASTSATLHARVDPNGADTHYYWEYGTTAAYGLVAPVASPGIDLGSAAGDRDVSAHLQGLEVGTVYHYRLVVAQAGETFVDLDRSFATQAVAQEAPLPDGRAWELVSPANKKGALIELFEAGGQVQAAFDGSGVTYLTNGPPMGEDPVGHVTLSQVLSKREGGVWRSKDLTLPGRLPENGEPAETIGSFQFEYRLFSPDLSGAAVEPQEGGTPLLSPDATERTLYLRDLESDAFTALVTTANVPVGTKIEEPNFINVAPSEWQMHFLVSTPDLRHVVFKTPLALTPEAVKEEDTQDNVSGRVQWNLYEWGSGQLQLINILPDEEVAHGRYPATPPVRLAGMAQSAGFGRGGGARDMSSDGRRIAWTFGEPYTPDVLKSYRGLYVRDTVEGRTVRVGGASAVYQTMNSDGSEVLFLENGDLYEFDFNSGIQTDLTATHGSGEPNAGVQELVSDVSEDGSSIYFVAQGILAPGGVGGKDNLYLLRDAGGGWTTTYIATLSPEDKPSWDALGSFGTSSLARISSRVSSDGRYLAFMSNRSLTDYDNTDAVNGAADEEVFLYDAGAGTLTCVSCNPTGARPTGVLDSVTSELLVDRQGAWTSRAGSQEDPHTDHWLAGSIPGWDSPGEAPATYQPRYLSDNGRLFFDSPDALVPHDTNGLEDVYEFEPAGVGDCARVDGCIGLLSSGTASAESAFFDASGSGDDVFFATTGKLVGEDYDKGFDVYDAHVCTSTVPCEPEPVLPPPCTSGDSCKAAPSPQPEIFGPPSTASFHGIGNVVVASHGSKQRSGALTRKQKLARALRACARRKGKRRAECERAARRRYAVRHARKATTIRAGRGQ